MKVSIITPCYNAEKYIQQTISAIQHQTFSDWEMIIVDDGSTDDSADIIQQIAQQDSRIKLVQQPNGGTASARNQGLSLAKGDYIQFLDADDTIAPDKLKRQIEIMDVGNIDLSYTDYQITSDDSTNNVTKGFTINLPRILMGWGIFGTLPIHAFIYSRKFLTKNNIRFNTIIKEREDWDFHIQVFSHNPQNQRLKGYCGAYYFRCPTGKTSCGSFSKIQKGTFRFLIYEIHHQHYIKRLLLLLRLSIGLIEVAMLTVKRKMNMVKDILPLFFHSFNTVLVFILALLFLPISCIIFIIRIIWVLSNK